MTLATFQTIDRDLLASATGGAGGGQQPQPPPHQDFASRYVSNIKQDWNDAQGRANRVVDNVHKGQYWEATKQLGAQTLDNIGLIGDALAPFRAAFGG